MLGIINVEEHNKTVNDLESKKSALKEAYDLGVKTFESNKPKMPKLQINKTALIPEYYSDGKVYGFKAFINGCEILSRKDSFCGYNVFNEKQKELLEFAACIIKAFGSIPQELIDSVEVK